MLRGKDSEGTKGVQSFVPGDEPGLPIRMSTRPSPMTNAERQKRVVELCKKIAVEKDDATVVRLTRELSELLGAQTRPDSRLKKIA